MSKWKCLNDEEEKMIREIGRDPKGMVVNRIGQDYWEVGGMNFGLALEAAKMGYRVARQGWNGKRMYVFLAHEPDFHTDADISEFDDAAVEVGDCLGLRTAQGTLQLGWLASQSDMLADDWYIVDEITAEG